MARAVVEKRPYKGLEFVELQKLENVKATWALSPTEKLVAKGTFTVDLHKNSYAFENEAVVTLWASQYPIRELRADNKGFFRLEVPLPLRKARDFFYTCAMYCDLRLKGVI